MTVIDAWVASEAKQKFSRQQVDLGPLGAEEVEVKVEHCGLCHSDLSVLNNDWGNSVFPVVLGHEAVGRVVAVGPAARGIEVGQRVGVGWNAGSCMCCRQCLSGDQHLCYQAQATILGHRGGFASHVRAHWAWAIPLPESINVAESGPRLCGGNEAVQNICVHAKFCDRVFILQRLRSCKLRKDVCFVLAYVFQ